MPPHLTLAREMAAAVSGETTSYRHKRETFVWPGQGRTAECRTDCSGFWNALLPKSYPAITPGVLQSWLKRRRPTASDYYDAIKGHRGFLSCDRIVDLKPGTFIAIKYEKGSGNTGHTFLVDESPHLISAQPPTEPDTTQYSVHILDVTSTPHGEGDTRSGTGLGLGYLRIYVNSDGTFAGHCWSMSPKCVYMPMGRRPMAAGTIDISQIVKLGRKRIWKPKP